MRDRCGCPQVSHTPSHVCRLTKRDTHASSAQHAQHAHHHHQWAAAGDADAAADAHEGADGTQSAAANGEYESIKPKLKKPKTLKTPSVYDQCKQECKRQRDEESVNQVSDRCALLSVCGTVATLNINNLCRRLFASSLHCGQRRLN